jgi:Protein of unknown function (DUF3011)/Peptidase inhibitor family I36
LTGNALKNIIFNGQEKPMRISTFLRLFGLPALLLLLPAIGSAQRSITCESNDGRRRYCGTEYIDARMVNIDRQISQSPCVRGRSWGVDNRGLWVDRGCRAVFTISNWNGGGQEGGWWKSDPGGDRWPPSGDWQGGNWGRGGACFYGDREFQGNYICLRRGESRESLGSLGDNISSIRVFGGARVTVYDDRDFRGRSASTRGDVPDMRQWNVGGSGHTWNNRISSVAVR